jgi:hypothetical protein
MPLLEALRQTSIKPQKIRYSLSARAKEFIAIERSDVPEKLEEFLGAKKSRRKK